MLNRWLFNWIARARFTSPTKAMRRAQLATKLLPHSPELWFQRALLRTDISGSEAGLDEYREGLKRCPDSDLLLSWFIKDLRTAGRFHEAADSTQRLREVAPDCAELYIFDGNDALREGSLQRARSLFEEAVSHAKPNQDALTMIYAAIGLFELPHIEDTERATELLGEVLDDPSEGLFAHLVLALHLQNDDPLRASDLMRKARDLASRQGMAATHFDALVAEVKESRRGR